MILAVYIVFAHFGAVNLLRRKSVSVFVSSVMLQRLQIVLSVIVITGSSSPLRSFCILDETIIL